ncbi:MAG: sigma-54 dependent transcriptional regulator [Gammaproteobacteria bacterium]|nr:sigma-54 dependent transcriptional regulator [Gammaproteobacteria bacterium]
MDKTGTILIVDDDEDILTAGRLLLRRAFATVETSNNPEQIPDFLASRTFDAVLLDMNFGPGESSGTQGMQWLQHILKIDPQMVVVMITAHGSMSTAVEAMKLGATDFVAKPWRNEKVIATVSAAVKLGRSRRESAILKQANQVLLKETATRDSKIVGDSEEMQAVFSIVERAAPTDANVLILGENGTGKELLARELHQQSHRAGNGFLTIDMGSLSESLFESELFGHTKGAFTDASEDRMGRLQAANGGTIFLDEVGNLPLHLQVKLLRVLEERSVTPVGTNESVPIDVRVISATNVAPKQLKDAAHFRQDLLFRLNTVELTVPPLRDRKSDILPIAKHYAGIYSRKYGGKIRRYSEAAETALMAYDWPGNVRALRHAVERSIILAEGETIEPCDLQLDYTDLPVNVDSVAAAPAMLNLDHLEKETVQKALRKHGFNISRAAAELGLTRASLYRRMEKHDL